MKNSPKASVREVEAKMARNGGYYSWANGKPTEIREQTIKGTIAELVTKIISITLILLIIKKK